MQTKGLHVVTIDEFPVPNPALADKFIEHGDIEVDGENTNKLRKFLNKMPKLPGFRKKKTTLMDAFEKSLKRESDQPFQLILVHGSNF